MGFKAKFAEMREEAQNQVAADKAKRAAAPPVVRGPSASFEGVKLKAGIITDGTTSGPVAGATARVESGADARRRITATRFIALGGIGGLLLKKQAGHVFLTIDHDDYQIVAEIPTKKESDARKFAAKINTAARG